jgi:hypothetical protein
LVHARRPDSFTVAFGAVVQHVGQSTDLVAHFIRYLLGSQFALLIFLFALVSQCVGQFFCGATSLTPLSDFLVVWSVRQARFSSRGLWISAFLVSSLPGARLFCRTRLVYRFFGLLFRRHLASRSLVTNSICPSGSFPGRPCVRFFIPHRSTNHTAHVGSPADSPLQL